MGRLFRVVCVLMTTVAVAWSEPAVGAGESVTRPAVGSENLALQAVRQVSVDRALLEAALLSPEDFGLEQADDQPLERVELVDPSGPLALRFLGYHVPTAILAPARPAQVGSGVAYRTDGAPLGPSDLELMSNRLLGHWQVIRVLQSVGPPIGDRTRWERAHLVSSLSQVTGADLRLVGFQVGGVAGIVWTVSFPGTVPQEDLVGPGQLLAQRLRLAEGGL